MNHPHQLHLAEFCAWHLFQVVANANYLAIARAMPIMKKAGGRIEDEPTVAEAAPGIATELYGGEGEDVSTVVMEDFEEDDAVRPEAWLNLPELLSLLLREKEVEAANRKRSQKQTRR